MELYIVSDNSWDWLLFPAVSDGMDGCKFWTKKPLQLHFTFHFVGGKCVHIREVSWYDLKRVITWTVYISTWCLWIIFMTGFRFAKHYMEDKIQKRTLLKVFGIRIDIIVQSLVSHVFKHILVKRIFDIESNRATFFLRRRESLISSPRWQLLALEWESLEWYVSSSDSHIQSHQLFKVCQILR